MLDFACLQGKNAAIWAQGLTEKLVNIVKTLFKFVISNAKDVLELVSVFITEATKVAYVLVES